MNNQIEKIARDFASRLNAEIGTENVIKAALLNKLNSDNACASHDFCDANMVMDAAMVADLGREVDTQDDGDNAIWNEAWNLAKSRHFYVFDGMKVPLYCKVVWDNGGNASGEFDIEFTTPDAADRWGRTWAANMNADDPTDDPDEDGYTYEVCVHYADGTSEIMD